VDQPGRTRALTANRTLAVFGGNDTSGERAGNSALTAHGSGRYDFESESFVVAATLNSGGNNGGFRTEPGAHLVCGALGAAQGAPDDNSAQARHIVAATLGAEHGRNRGLGQENETGLIVPQGGVRRLTPGECEALQGFEKDWTVWGVDEDGSRIEMSDSARYRALGNAVNRKVSAWIDSRLALIARAARA
jgi:site-specific DNA-cytosine methylase